MPDGHFSSERTSGVEHKIGIESHITVEAKENGSGTFTLESTDEHARAAFALAIGLRFDADRMHVTTHASRQVRFYQIEIDPGTPAVTEDLGTKVALETETALKRMGISGGGDEGIEKAA